MPSHLAVMKEAGGDPDGNKIVAIMGHEWDDSCNRWVYKVEWKQGKQGWMPVSTLSRSKHGAATLISSLNCSRISVALNARLAINQEAIEPSKVSLPTTSGASDQRFTVASVSVAR